MREKLKAGWAKKRQRVQQQLDAIVPSEAIQPKPAGKPTAHGPVKVRSLNEKTYYQDELTLLYRWCREQPELQGVIQDVDKLGMCEYLKQAVMHLLAKAKRQQMSEFALIEPLPVATKLLSAPAPSRSVEVMKAESEQRKTERLELERLRGEVAVYKDMVQVLKEVARR